MYKRQIIDAMLAEYSEPANTHNNTSES